LIFGTDIPIRANQMQRILKAALFAKGCFVFGIKFINEGLQDELHS